MNGRAAGFGSRRFCRSGTGRSVLAEFAMPISAFSTGFAVSATLIIAIGAQNAFVLRQGLRREHVLIIVAFCVLADLLLIGAGVAGVAHVLGQAPRLTLALT